MPDIEKVINAFEICLQHIDEQDCPESCPYLEKCKKYENRVIFQPLMMDALLLLKAQEPREITKNEWQMWKKDKRRDPICMVFEGDTTPFWVINPEQVNEILYLTGKIKLFTKKPEKGRKVWNE